MTIWILIVATVAAVCFGFFLLLPGKWKHEDHHPPYDMFYEGNWAQITICPECNMHGLYWDCHPVNPCWRCGAEIEEGHTGRWDKKTGTWEMKRKKT